MTEEHTEVICFVDPVCPFAWVTSRWLSGQTHRGADVRWRQMSLAILNEGRDVDGPHAERIAASRRVGRVVAAATAGRDDAEIGDLYAALGRRIHTEGNEASEEVLRAALAECELDTDAALAADDASFDDAVRRRHALSQSTLGEPGGSPITVIDGHAFFGPVLTEIPTGARADELFDALATMAAEPGFAQFQRPRSGPPSPIDKGAA